MTIDKSLTIKIVTPEDTVFSGVADMLVIPGSEGELGILPNHIPLITMLREGILKVYTNNRITAEILISKGYGQVFGNEIVILTEFALNLAEISMSQLQENLTSLEEKLEKTQLEANRVLIKQDISRHKLILDHSHYHANK